MSPASVIPLKHALFNPQAQVCADCGVRRFALFGVLDHAALDSIHVHIADIRLQPGQSLYAAQAVGSAAYTVREGIVRLERTSERGERRILRLAGRSDMLGLEAMLGQTYAADAVACTEVSVCRVPRTLVDELSRDRPEILVDLMKRWQRALDDADEWLTELCSGPARHRMLRLLLKLSEYADGGSVWLPARLEMSAMLDMTIETASRLISQLKREGVLDAPDQRHAVIHMDALLKALREDSAAS
ncbi:Crp/Fnr family transcriptional regulator [Ideonella sp. 4Y16]|uniref:Crp/Fnr family transcriptional regulator n=1 Tax=Ideonella alba TaxID=2824118 RepID=A0A941BH05_9BURK|nr:Crp/Fnr family transcriptional regulator [Ideonella alba]MBQ0932642.1 Crp/Fnr family transcriptional regulator [Ideonella alba]MBQ0943501.1 Crp/Fnr family transcriptional regulator [Ideonella alba]